MNKEERRDAIYQLALEGLGRRSIMNKVPGTTEWEVRQIINQVNSERNLSLEDTPINTPSRAVVEGLKPIRLTLPRNRKIASSLPKDHQVLVAVSDTHGSEVDERALDVCCQIISDINPTILAHLGDLGDFYSVSKYDKNPKRRLSLQQDLVDAVSILGKLDQAVSSSTRKMFFRGNHESRIERFISHNAPVLGDLDILSIPNLLGLEHLGWEYYKQDLEVFPEFLIKHGETVRPHTAYTAKAEVEKSWMGGISGHTHRLGMYSFTSRRNHLKGIAPTQWVENGCLCNMDEVEYVAGTANWQQGFSIVRYIDGVILPEIVPIFNGTAFYNGKFYKG